MTSLSGAFQYLLMEFPCDSCLQVIFLTFLFSLMSNQMPWLNKDKEQHAKRIVALWGNSHNPNYCLILWRTNHVKTVEFELLRWFWFTQRPRHLADLCPGAQCHKLTHYPPWKPVGPLSASMLCSISPPSWAPGSTCTACHFYLNAFS